MEKRKTGLSYKELGIPLESEEHGRLILTRHSPKTGEIFLLREKENTGIAAIMPTHSAPPEQKETNTLYITLLKKGAEEPVGFLEYAPLKGSTFVKDVGTAFGHRKRDVASSMLAYLKTHGKDIWLVAGLGSAPFYRKLGFAKSEKYNRMLALPAGKPLAMRRGEKKTRRFLITPPKVLKR